MTQKEKIKITLEPRQEKGKEAAKQMRRNGWVPGVFYSHATGKEQAISVKMKTKELIRVLQLPGVTHHLLDLSMQDGITKGIIKSVQKNPCKEEFWHIDFYGVKDDQKLIISVPVMIKGESEGIKMGGVLEQVTAYVSIECLPDAIPEGIEADISFLEIGGILHVRDLKAPEGVEIKDNPDEVILLIAAPRVSVEEEEEAVEAAEEEAAEPKRVGEEEGEEKEE